MALTKVTSGVRTLGTGEVTAANLASGVVDTTGLEDDVALLGFKVASNGSLAKYNLVDQTVDDFQDTSGVDASASTNESRNSSGKYYSGTETPVASGGTITTDGDYTVHKFTASGTYTTDTAQDVEYLVVAGGGAGGGTGTGSDHMGGGGGAGGYRTATGFATTATSYSITVGDGGTAATDASGNDGADSVFSTITSSGGGGGGGPAIVGTAGGSGGGGSYDKAGGAGNTPSTSPVQGYAGGSSGAGGATAGGGGASEVGEGAVSTSGPSGAGGDGVANDIVLTSTDVTYGGGGGGGKSNDYSGGAGAGGAGGGGAGGKGAVGNAGTANTGGAGGGAGNDAGTNKLGGVGGSGIVVIRRPTTGGVVNMTLVSATTAAQAAPTKGDIVLTYTNGAGTTTLDTDLTAEISADGGSTWTALALGSEGSTGSHNIATSHDITIGSTITAPYNMAYRIKTLNQSASKTTRIQAVSLGWS
jgi:hypothetical protein